MNEPSLVFLIRMPHFSASGWSSVPAHTDTRVEAASVLCCLSQWYILKELWIYTSATGASLKNGAKIGYYEFL